AYTGTHRWLWGGEPEGQVMLAEAIPICERAGDIHMVIWSQGANAAGYVFETRYDVAQPLAASVDRAARDFGAPALLAEDLGIRAWAELGLGNLVTARRLADEALEHYAPVSHINQTGPSTWARAMVDIAQGRAADARASLRDAVRRFLRDDEPRFVPL